jgi:hypothetical protein
VSERRTHAIVWCRGDAIYTHSDRDGATILYSTDELESVVGLDPDRIFDELNSLEAVFSAPQSLHAVPAKDLRSLLGEAS